MLAALELPRTEPKHYLSAILSLVDLGRPELAAPILKEFVGQNLNDEQKAALVNEFGSRRFLQLARVAALAPEAPQFAEACMNAAAAQARDPQRLAKLIGNLNSPSAATRSAARFDLAATGEPGVVATLEALARETDPQRRSAIAAAAVAMDPSAVDPLLGMLATTDPALRHDVIRILKAMHVTLARPFIAAASSSSDAARLLDEAIGRNKRGMRSFATDENNTVALWHWDDATKKLTATRYPIDEAQTIWAARLALEYAKLRPDDRLAQCQALVLGLEADGLVGGPRSPDMEKLLSAADGVMLNMVLGAAMKHDFPLAAATVAAVIGQRGDASTLYASAPSPAPLADALTYPNRRVRFAALEAIMALDPKTPFPAQAACPKRSAISPRAPASAVPSWRCPSPTTPPRSPGDSADWASKPTPPPAADRPSPPPDNRPISRWCWSTSTSTAPASATCSTPCVASRPRAKCRSVCWPQRNGSTRPSVSPASTSASSRSRGRSPTPRSRDC